MTRKEVRQEFVHISANTLFTPENARVVELLKLLCLLLAKDGD